MPRRLTDELNELIIRDNISGSEIKLSYRLPATAERAAYANESFRRKGNKVETRIVETRQKYGKLILSGIREGDFEVRVGDRIQPLAGDPASPNYAPDWRELVAQHAGDLLELLAAHVFDGSCSVGAAARSDDDSGDDGTEKN